MNCVPTLMHACKTEIGMHAMLGELELLGFALLVAAEDRP